MIRSVLRLFWPTIDPTPSPRQRAAELSAAYAVATFLDAGVAPTVSLDLRHRTDGLSGTRTWRMVDVQQATFDERPAAAASGLRAVRSTLAIEIGSADRRDVGHLRMLDAFATGLEALRRAEADDPALDEAARDRIAEQAAAAADALPDEPYLRNLQARTLERLGRPDDAATLLQGFTGRWLEDWQAVFRQSIDYYRSAAGRLPRGDAAVRLRAMSTLPGWLDEAGADLPDLLAAEAGPVPYVPVDPLRFVVQVCETEWSEERASGLIGSTDDASGQATIGALRAVIRQRFGVVLPSVNLRAVALPPGEAIVFVDGIAIATASNPRDMALVDGVDAWWPGVTGAPPALRALLVGALRQIARMPLATPPASREAAEAGALMRADRMPIASPGDGGEGGPVVQVAATRLGPHVAADLWGNAGDPVRLLLDADTEAALQAAVVDGHGLAVPVEVFNRLSRALRTRIETDPRVVLLVRDPLLRPLLRLLLQDDFPDLPVMALAEVDLRDGRGWGALLASAAATGSPA